MKRPQQSAPNPAEQLAAARQARIVASATVQEAIDKAPATNARLEAAVRELAAAVSAADAAALGVVTAKTKVADAEDTVTAKQAVLEDRENDPGAKPGQVETARAAHSKALRALTAAEHALISAEGVNEAAAHLVAECEERLATVREEPPVEHSSVLKARAALDAADAKVRQAEVAVAIAERDREEKENPVPRFASVEAFVQFYVLPNWRHSRGRESHWCFQWWKHDEAVTRLEALWESYEVARREEKPAISAWLLNEFDRHMAALTSPAGTFAGCGPADRTEHHVSQVVWPSQPAPEGLFETDPASVVQPDHTQQEGAAA